MIKPNYLFKEFIRGEKLYKDSSSGTAFNVGTVTSAEQLDELLENAGGFVDDDGVPTGDSPKETEPIKGEGIKDGPQLGEDKKELSEEEIEKLINDNGKEIDSLEKSKEEEEKLKEEKKEEEKKEEEKKEEEIKDELSEAEKELEEYVNTVDMLNKKFDLKLNEEAIKDISSVEERGTVLELVQNILHNAQSKISEFSEVKEILEDKEIADFIAAKKEGKTLRDFVSEYAGTPQGSPDDTVVYNYLKGNTPALDDEAIKSTIETLKEKGKFEATVDAARKHTEQQNLAREQAIEREREASLEGFKSYLESQNEVFGVQLTDKLKTQFYRAVAEKDDSGMSYLERALQSNENVLKAVIAIAGLDKVVSALGTTIGNQKKNSFVSKLTGDASTLQSGKEKKSSDQKLNDDEYYQIANQTGY